VVENSQPADSAARTEALDINRSFIVQAPAGSGKTELLIRRIMHLLLTVELPEQVVAITFTRKAAAEMRERIRSELQDAYDKKPLESDYKKEGRELALQVLRRDRELDWNLLENPQRLGLQTIDSLCALLTRELPLTSTLGSAPAADENASELYQMAALRSIEDGLDDDSAFGESLHRLLGECDNQLPRLAQLIADMLGDRDQWGRVLHAADQREELEGSLCYVVEQRLLKLAELMPTSVDQSVQQAGRWAVPALRGLNPDGSWLADEFEKLDSLPEPVIEDLPKWRALAELLLTQKGDCRKTVNKNQGFPAAGDAKLLGLSVEEVKSRKADFVEGLKSLQEHSEFCQALHLARELPDGSYSDEQWQLLKDLLCVLQYAMANLTLEFADNMRCDFTQIALGANDALGTEEQPTDLALSLDYRIRHILVDEFQDTSQSQYQLFRKLVAGWEPGDGRTFFVVGDPMQSIYRFRDAEVGLFAEAQQDGVAHVTLEPLQLTTNFRSSHTIVEWCNENFQGIFPTEVSRETGAVSFSSSVAFAASGSESDSVTDGDNYSDVQWHIGSRQNGPLQANKIASVARTLLQDYPEQSVAILVRSRSNLSEMFHSLRSSGIACRAVEMEALDGRPVVADLRSLTFALLYPHDRVAWLSLLRAPWCGLTLHELFAITHLHPRKPLWDLITQVVEQQAEVEADAEKDEEESSDIVLSPESRQRLERFVRIMQPAVERARREHVVAWVEACWQQLGGPAVCVDEGDLDAAEMAIAALLQMQESGELSNRGRVATKLSSLYAPARIPAGPHVQVMTIHKSKGLEFDSVLLPFLERRPRSDTSGLLNWFETLDDDANAHYLVAPLDTRMAKGADKERIAALIRSCHADRERNERLRLLYVAATRARTRLHLFADADANADGELKSPVKSSLLDLLWQQAQAQAHAVFDQTGEADQDIDEAGDAAQQEGSIALNERLQRLPPDWQMPGEMAAFQWPAEVEAKQSDDGLADETHERPEFLWAGIDAPAIGTVVHQQLQLLCQAGIASWQDQSQESRNKAMHQALTSLGLVGDRLDTAVAKVEKALAQCLADEKGRWLLDNSHSQGVTEHALTAWLEDDFHNVVIDRMFVEDGVRWIIDYKTGDHRGGAVDEFLDREQERYAPQLERYAQLVAIQSPEPIKLGLYFPLLQGFRSWEPSNTVT